MLARVLVSACLLGRPVRYNGSAKTLEDALLTDGSPSCGDSFIYDGTFKGRRIDGEGVTAALLRQHGITVFLQTEISSLAAALDG